MDFIPTLAPSDEDLIRLAHLQMILRIAYSTSHQWKWSKGGTLSCYCQAKGYNRGKHGILYPVFMALAMDEMTSTATSTGAMPFRALTKMRPGCRYLSSRAV